MMITINVSEIINKTLPGVTPADLHRTVCLYSPLDINFLLVFNILYIIIMDHRIADRLFGDFSGTDLRSQILKAMFSKDSFYSNLIAANLIYLLMANLGPLFGLTLPPNPG